MALAVACSAAAFGCSAGDHARRLLEDQEDEPVPVVAVNLPAETTPPVPVPPPSLEAEAPPEPPAEVVAEGSAETAATDSEPLVEAPRAELESPELFAIAREVIVRERPSHSAKKIGYLRLGARVRRSAEPVATAGCQGGWYRITPEGYVCAGSAATLDGAHPALALANMPDRSAGLPYAYGKAMVPPPRLTALPPPGKRAPRAPAGWGDVENAPIPALLLGGSLPRVHGYGLAGDSSVASGTPPNSGFALLSVYDQGSGRFGLTTDLELVPLERLERVKPSNFRGVSLSDGDLPLAFVHSRSAWLYSGEPKKGLSIARRLGFREPVSLSGESLRSGGVTYLRTRAGDWLKDERLVRIDPLRSPPSFARGERSWLHVSILKQSLVAYRGAQPVYATLVSTGIGGLGDPQETHATVRGSFLVHTKHVSTTMDSEQEDDPFLLSDVPYVQYFHEGYALHAAYWHDSFGSPRSHGCINLSPLDARYLFHWTEPPVPQAWHGALSLREGTLVYITP